MVQVLNSFSLGVLLLILASGLALIFGLRGTVAAVRRVDIDRMSAIVVGVGAALAGPSAPSAVANADFCRLTRFSAPLRPKPQNEGL